MGKFATDRNGNIASGTEVLANNMVFLQKTKEQDISNLFGDFFSRGILNINMGIDSNPIEPFTLQEGTISGTLSVGIGIAYVQDSSTSFYKRIAILDEQEYSNIAPNTDPILTNGTGPQQRTYTGVGNEYVVTPKSTGCINIPIPNTNIKYYVDVRYLNVCDNGNLGDGLNLKNYSIAKNISSASMDQRKRFYQWIDGYNIVLITNLAQQQGIILGTVQRNIDNTVNITYDNRTSNLMLRNELLPSVDQWGNIAGNIYDQEDLWGIILSGGLDNRRTWAENIGGYPKGTVLRFYEKNGSYLVRSLIDNNMEEPSINNIKYRNTDINKTWECIERVVIDTMKDGPRWYRLYSDRWCEQGDRVENTSTSVTTYINVTFSKQFEDTNYQLQITPWGKLRAGSYNLAIGVLNAEETNADIICFAIDDNPDYVQWEAKGYVQSTTIIELLNISNIRNGSSIVEQIGNDIIVGADETIQIIMAGAGVSGSGGGMLNCIHKFEEATKLRLKRINGRDDTQIGLVLFKVQIENNNTVEIPILAVGGRARKGLSFFSVLGFGGSGYNGGQGYNRGYSYDGSQGNSTIDNEGACGNKEQSYAYGGSGYVHEDLQSDTQTVSGTYTTGNGTYAYARIYKIEE